MLASEKIYTRGVEMPPATGVQKEDVFWFDYVSDTGDGQMPTYNIAYLTAFAGDVMTQ